MPNNPEIVTQILNPDTFSKITGGDARVRTLRKIGCTVTTEIPKWKEWNSIREGNKLHQELIDTSRSTLSDGLSRSGLFNELSKAFPDTYAVLGNVIFHSDPIKGPFQAGMIIQLSGERPSEKPIPIVNNYIVYNAEGGVDIGIKFLRHELFSLKKLKEERERIAQHPLSASVFLEKLPKTGAYVQQVSRPHSEVMWIPQEIWKEDPRAIPLAVELAKFSPIQGWQPSPTKELYLPYQ